jgi:replicative DNA helicase
LNPSRKTNKNPESGNAQALSSALEGRTLPVSIEAEAATLGSMILDRECIGQVVEQFGADAVNVFSLPEHQHIFEAIVGLYEANSKIDLVLLRDELIRRDRLKAAGGVDYLVRIAESVPTAANVDYYTRIVRDKAMLRQLARVSQDILRQACDEAGDVGEKLDVAEQQIFAVTEKKISGSAIAIRQLITETFEIIESRKGSHITGLPTGFDDLNDQLCGLHPGELIIVAGRPSMGKTSFALNIAEHIGADNNIPVAVFSLEMSRQQLVERILCSRAKVDSQLVRKGMVGPEDHALLMQVGGELYEKPIFIDDTPGLTPLMLRAKCRRLKSQYHIQGIFVDYLQLMGLGGQVESRQQEISTISRYLKALARELEVPVMVLSQLNRSPEGREDHRPRMSDLRESGSIEQDADVILLLHREDYYNKGKEEFEETNTAEVIIAKQRNGPTDTVKLHFDGRYTRFEKAAPSYIKEPF